MIHSGEVRLELNDDQGSEESGIRVNMDVV